MKSKKKKTRKFPSLILIMVCAALITVGAVLLFFSLFAIFKVYQVPMSLEVGDGMGFNTDTDAVKFGKVMPGSTSSRVIVITHDYKKPLLVQMKGDGNISKLINIPEQFYLEPGLRKEVHMNAIVPNTISKGKYEGTLTVYFRRI